MTHRTEPISLPAPILEPGLLPTFRTFVVIRFSFAVISNLLRYEIAPTWGLMGTLLIITIETLFLLLYLNSTHFQRSLGRLYLPLALVAISLFPFVETLFRNQGMLLRGGGGDAQVPVLTLLTVTILIAWQYRLGPVLAYSLLSGLMLLALSYPVVNLGGQTLGYAIFSALSTAVFLGIVGFVVNRLVRILQAQRSELARAYAELQNQTEIRTQLAATQERNRLAGELHDVLAHAFSALAIELEAVRSLWYENPQRAYEMLQKALSSANTGLDEARRAVRAIRAKPLETLGLARSILKMAKDTAERGHLKLHLDIDHDIVGLSDDREQAVYRIAGEAIANVLQHAHAANLAVSLKRRNGSVCLSVSDDGRGFKVNASRLSGIGLQGMRSRAVALGGRLDIRSSPPNGSQVIFTLEENQK